MFVKEGHCKKYKVNYIKNIKTHRKVYIKGKNLHIKRLQRIVTYFSVNHIVLVNKSVVVIVKVLW